MFLAIPFELGISRPLTYFLFISSMYHAPMNSYYGTRRIYAGAVTLPQETGLCLFMHNAAPKQTKRVEWARKKRGGRGRGRDKSLQSR